MTLVSSLLSFLSFSDFPLVMFGLGVYECFRAPFISTLSFSASYGSSLKYSLLHIGDILTIRWISGSYDKVGPMGQQRKLGLGVGTLDKFFTHLPVGGVGAVAVELPCVVLLCCFCSLGSHLYGLSSHALLAQSLEPILLSFVSPRS